MMGGAVAETPPLPGLLFPGVELESRIRLGFHHGCGSAKCSNPRLTIAHKIYHIWVAVKELKLSYHNGYIVNNMVSPI